MTLKRRRLSGLGCSGSLHYLGRKVLAWRGPAPYIGGRSDACLRSPAVRERERLASGREDSMARRGCRARTHAWLARDLAGNAGDGGNPLAADSDEPFLPEVGHVYLVVTRIYALRFDPAAKRPAVVVTVPPPTVTHTPIQTCSDYRVEPTGLEPVTPCLQSKCATNCAMAPRRSFPVAGSPCC